MEENTGKVEIGDVFTVIDENDQEQDIEVLGLLEIEGDTYAAVGLADEIQKVTEEDCDVFFLRIEGEDELANSESDEEFEKVSAAFMAAEAE